MLGIALTASASAGFTAGAGASLRIMPSTPSPMMAYKFSPPEASAIKPLNDFILIDLQSVPDATNVGILLPTTFHNEFDDAEFLAPECRTGTVVAMGPGRLAKDGSRVPMPPLEIGQKVVVGPAKGERVELFGQSLQDSTHFLFTPEEVWAAN